MKKEIIRKTIKYFLNENMSDDMLIDIIFNNQHIFTYYILVSYHARIENFFIAKFYLKEFLKYYDVSDLKKNKKLGRICWNNL